MLFFVIFVVRVLVLVLLVDLVVGGGGDSGLVHDVVGDEVLVVPSQLPINICILSALLFAFRCDGIMHLGVVFD